MTEAAPQRKESFADKWLKLIPLIISISALALSAYGFYRTQIEVREGLLAHPLQMDVPGFGDPSGGSGPFRYQARSRILFQNAGNRSAVILEVALKFVFRPLDDRRTDNDVCQDRYATSATPNSGGLISGAHTGRLPLVLPAGEIALLESTHEVQFDWDEAYYNGTIPICLWVELLDASGQRRVRQLPFANWQIWPEADRVHGAGGSLREQRMVLLGSAS